MQDNYLFSTDFLLEGLPQQKLMQHNLMPWQLGPLLQGLMMEQIDTNLAAALHQLSFNPYSQYVYANEDGFVWRFNILSAEFRELLVTPLAQAQDLRIKKLDLPLRFQVIHEQSYSYQNLAALISAAKPPSSFKLRFVTPTSFKRDGTYQLLPDLCLIYQNALMRYGSIINKDRNTDAETLDYLLKHTQIIKYNLRSCAFHVGGYSIPAFTGTMSLSIRGPATLKGLVNMLLKFSEFGGMGIKTAMGMGGFSLL